MASAIALYGTFGGLFLNFSDKMLTIRKRRKQKKHQTTEFRYKTMFDKWQFYSNVPKKL